MLFFVEQDVPIVANPRHRPHPFWVSLALSCVRICRSAFPHYPYWRCLPWRPIARQLHKIILIYRKYLHSCFEKRYHVWNNNSIYRNVWFTSHIDYVTANRRHVVLCSTRLICVSLVRLSRGTLQRLNDWA